MAQTVLYISTDKFDKLWVDFSINKDRRFFPVHVMCKELGSDKSITLRFFHRFTGCNQRSIC